MRAHTHLRILQLTIEISATVKYEEKLSYIQIGISTVKGVNCKCTRIQTLWQLGDDLQNYDTERHSSGTQML
jgi:hypothetical protein